MSKIIKIILGVAVLAIIGFVATKFLQKGASSSTSGISSTSGLNPAQPVAAQTDPNVLDAQDKTDALVALLSKVSSIKLDTRILDSEAFLNLKDLSITITKDNNPGRPNPFLPIGSNGRASDLPIDTVATPNTTSPGL